MVAGQETCSIMEKKWRIWDTDIRQQGMGVPALLTIDTVDFEPDPRLCGIPVNEEHIPKTISIKDESARLTNRANTGAQAKNGDSRIIIFLGEIEIAGNIS